MNNSNMSMEFLQNHKRKNRKFLAIANGAKKWPTNRQRTKNAPTPHIHQMVVSKTQKSPSRLFFCTFIRAQLFLCAAALLTGWMNGWLACLPAVQQFSPHFCCPHNLSIYGHIFLNAGGSERRKWGSKKREWIHEGGGMRAGRRPQRVAVAIQKSAIQKRASQFNSSKSKKKKAGRPDGSCLPIHPSGMMTVGREQQQQQQQEK